MRYIEIGEHGKLWGDLQSSSVATVAVRALPEADEPTVVLTVSLFEEVDVHDGEDVLAGAASIHLTADGARSFAERLVRSADEAEERTRRAR